MEKRKSIIFNGRTFEKTDYYKVVNGKLYRNVAAGLIVENRRPYRKAGSYDLYIDSFPNAALPYSNYYIADKESGSVYKSEVLQGMSDNRRYIKELVEYLKQENCGKENLSNL